jgi:hypothetical protein
MEPAFVPAATRRKVMATNKPTGDNARKGAVKEAHPIEDVAGRPDDIHETLEVIGALRRSEEGARQKEVQRRAHGKIRARHCSR